MQPTPRVLCLSSDTPLKKTKFLFASGYHLEEASRKGWGHVCTSLSALGPHVVQTSSGPIHTA